MASDREHKSTHILMMLGLGALVGLGIIQSSWLLTVVAGLMLYLAHDSRKLYRARMVAERRIAEKVADELHFRTIEALAAAIDAKDNATHLHLHRVVFYAEAISKEMALPQKELQALRVAALLHDIGKLAVPEYIISKPGRLTEEEFERMKIHTLVGAEILERVQFPYPVVPIVRSHHERWDGKGYPDGLKEEGIPIGARILTVVDSFDALTSDRPYRRAVEPKEALTMIKREAGKVYDPRIVEILERLYPRLASSAQSCSQSWTQLSTKVRIEKGAAPLAGLSVEKAGDTSSALESIAEAQQELQVLYELTQALGNSLSVEETLKLVTSQLQKVIRFQAIAIYLVSDGKLTPRFVEGLNSALLARLQIPVGEGLSGWVVANGKPVLNGVASVEPGYVHDPTQFSKLRSALSVPLDSPRGIIGALTLYSIQYNSFTVDHLRILKAIGLKAGSTIHNALIHEAIGNSAQTDALTSLPNARALASRLEEELARATREHTSFSIFMIDLNGLKQINDRLGHLTGNKVIKAVAGALRACLRPYDFLARVGGDEFVLLLSRMDTENAAEKRIELSMAVRELSKSFSGTDISVSMGAASYPGEGKNTDELMALADRRMYWHKREHYKNRGVSLAAART
ncbi:MAG: diguanylate cyclase [Acidobacteria bacterium]|nr:diguanylate cyclase [Acidobacteriota bacterium]